MDVGISPRTLDGEPTTGPQTAPRWAAWTRRARAQAASLGREAGGVVGAGLDGVLIGLTVAFVVATAWSGPSTYLGLPWAVEVVVVGAGVSLLALGGAAVAVGVARIVAVVGHALGRLTSRSRPVQAVVALPFGLIASLPAAWLGGFAVLLWLGTVGHGMGPFGLFVPAGALSPYIYVTGIALGLLAAARAVVLPIPRGPIPRNAIRRVRQLVAAALIIPALVLATSAAALFVSPGATDALVPPTAALDGIAHPAAPADPGLPGPFEVLTFSYGSGTDSRRTAFGRDATIVTPTIDASAVLPALGNGADEARQWFWGFGTNALPLNGLVWMPSGAGPFPLVLMVHGNHAMGDFSEPGYAYLGSHLASLGYVAVSVDEDFLNGSWADDWEGAEQVVRSWLLLLHVDQWRTWNADPSSDLYGTVDLDRIALIGHSRGGEAAAVAAMLADRSGAPRAGLDPWPTGLHVAAVVAIAPSDGQYGPGTTLKGTDLLAISGGHDADVRGWVGLRQYARTTITDGGFKAAFWSYRANHGQFNTVWGRSDQGANGGALLNLAPILDGAAQEDVSKTAIGAFLEASLRDKDEYRGFFRRPMVGREWLPEDIYLVRSIDDRFEPLTMPNAAGLVEGIEASFEGFDSHRSGSIPLRALQPDQGIQGLLVRWTAGTGDASWGLRGLDGLSVEGRPTAIHVALANGAEPGAGAGVLDPRLELTTTDGVTVELPLSRWGALPPPLTVSLTKNDLLSAVSGIDLSVRSPVERVLQTYAIPLADFEAADPAFDGDRLAAFRVIVERSSPGALWITEVGLAR